jgi:hypothetical protein
MRKRNRIVEWWKRITREEYEMVIWVADTVTTHQDGERTKTWKAQTYHAKKIVKQGPKHFIFYDLEGKKNEIKYLEPVDFHIVKVW